MLDIKEYILNEARQHSNYTILLWSQDSAISTLLWLQVGQQKNHYLIPGRCKSFYSPNSRDKLWGPPAFYSVGTMVLFWLV